MTALCEPAPAKVNLSLAIIGRRSDGYHELQSLVAFATVGDVLELAPGDIFSLAVRGPFAASLDGPNLIERAVERTEAAANALGLGLVAGAFTLEKRLPVASGIGGGSADAAAALRLLRRANPALADRLDWAAIAATLGADVPVCLLSRAALMWGIGERVVPLPALPDVAVLLANPRVPLTTAEVFRALAAPPLGSHSAAAPVLPAGSDGATLARMLAAHPNDLEPPARRLRPVIGEVIDHLARLPGALLVRMSGSGATCLALFASLDEAQRGAAALTRQRPDWWVAAGRLG